MTSSRVWTNGKRARCSRCRGGITFDIMPKIAVESGVELEYQITGDGDPVLLIMATTGSLGMWGPIVPALAERHEVIAYDHRGMGGSTPSEDAVSMRSLADDAAALLEALDVGPAHVIGWSLGSAVAQELALNHADKVTSLVLYGTWGRCDGFGRSMIAALRFPWTRGDVATALAALGLAWSPQMLDDPAFETIAADFLPLVPQTEAQVRMTVAQWDADLVHDTLDRLGNIMAPTTVIVGDQDLLTPPRQSLAVAERIPGAEFHLVEGAGSSHSMHLERTEDWLDLVRAHLERHALTTA
jgi:pimeloyl-ACP methyl ester carboxylesterase